VTPTKLNLRAGDETTWLHASGTNISFGAESPGWRALRRFSADPDASDVVEDFVHLASQYVFRSRMVRAIGALAVVYGVAIDFRQADMKWTTIERGARNADRDRENERLRRLYMRGASRSARAKSIAAWIEALNPLDPFIHRAVFQFWRSIALEKHDFLEEGVTALDGLVAVAAEASQRWCGAKTNSRREVAHALGLSKDDGALLEFLYRLRCGFGAHPAASKWWDFAEIYDLEFEQFYDVCRRVLWQLASLERKNRRVKPAPSVWSTWFVENAEMILDVTWLLRDP
jgi:hypothetical protein